MFIDHIRRETDKGKLTGAIFIDLSKAFDTVSHSVLLSKLPTYGVMNTEFQWLTVVEYQAAFSNAIHADIREFHKDQLLAHYYFCTILTMQLEH